MQNYSLTIAGLVGAIALPLLVNIGFSDGCANEVVAFLMPLPGIITAWIGRVRQGDVTILGAKKTDDYTFHAE